LLRQRLLKYDTQGKTVSMAWNSWLLYTVFNTYRHKDFGHNKRSLSVVLSGYKNEIPKFGQTFSHSDIFFSIHLQAIDSILEE
jgi:hypothetical protein